MRKVAINCVVRTVVAIYRINLFSHVMKSGVYKSFVRIIILAIPRIYRTWARKGIQQLSYPAFRSIVPIFRPENSDSITYFAV